MPRKHINPFVRECDKFIKSSIEDIVAKEDHTHFFLDWKQIVVFTNPDIYHSVAQRADAKLLRESSEGLMFDHKVYTPETESNYLWHFNLREKVDKFKNIYGEKYQFG